MADKKFDLGSYVEVKDRIKLFYELFGQGRLVTANYELTREPDDKPKVIVTAYAYRTTDDPHPGVGTSWMYLPGKTSYTVGSEIENVETSAWGRAIGALGILIDRSIATSTEIRDKQDDEATEATSSKPTSRKVAAEPTGPRQDTNTPDTKMTPAGSWLGTGAIGIGNGTFDGTRRQGAEGSVFGFKFDTTDNKTIPQVLVEGSLAEDVADALGAEVKGTLATISGDLFNVDWYKHGKDKPPIQFQRLHLRSIQTAAWTLPVPVQTGPGLFDAEAERELDGIL